MSQTLIKYFFSPSDQVLIKSLTLETTLDFVWPHLILQVFATCWAWMDVNPPTMCHSDINHPCFINTTCVTLEHVPPLPTIFPVTEYDTLTKFLHHLAILLRLDILSDDGRRHFQNSLDYSVLARHESMRLFDVLFSNFDAFYSQMKELFKSFKPEVKASKSVKRFQSNGHLKFCIEIWALQVSRRLGGTKVLQKYLLGIHCIK